MIARIWHGWAPKETAADYERHYASVVADHLTQVDGFQGARLLRHDDGDEVRFTSITFFASLDSVRGFAGTDYDQAVLEPAARRALSHWDDQVTHDEVAFSLG